MLTENKTRGTARLRFVAAAPSRWALKKVKDIITVPEVEHGRIVQQLREQRHRPGAFTAKWPSRNRKSPGFTAKL
jgi:hypothetical protein